MTHLSQIGLGVGFGLEPEYELMPSLTFPDFGESEP